MQHMQWEAIIYTAVLLSGSYKNCTPKRQLLAPTTVDNIFVVTSSSKALNISNYFNCPFNKFEHLPQLHISGQLYKSVYTRLSMFYYGIKKKTHETQIQSVDLQMLIFKLCTTSVIHCCGKYHPQWYQEWKKIQFRITVSPTTDLHPHPHQMVAPALEVYTYSVPHCSPILPKLTSHNNAIKPLESCQLMGINMHA